MRGACVDSQRAANRTTQGRTKPRLPASQATARHEGGTTAPATAEAERQSNASTHSAQRRARATTTASLAPLPGLLYQQADAVPQERDETMAVRANVLTGRAIARNTTPPAAWTTPASEFWVMLTALGELGHDVPGLIAAAQL